jgi:hypothetical protein
VQKKMGHWHFVEVPARVPVVETVDEYAGPVPMGERGVLRRMLHGGN